MSTAGISAAVDQAVDDAIAELDSSGVWSFSVDSPELRAIIAALVRATLERLEAKGAAGGDPIQIDE